MADKELQIKLTAVGAPQAAAEVEKVKDATEGVAEATQEAAKATAQQTAATNPWITASRGMTTATKEQTQAQNTLAEAVDKTGQVAEVTERKVRSKKKAVEEAGDAAKKAAGTKGGGGGGGGQGLLALSQSLQDLQYGIGGILNNIPQLVAGLGLGAGVAGVVQMAMVGAYNAMNLLKEGAATPIDWSKLTPEEEQKKQLDELTESLKKQREHMDGLAEAWERRNRAQRASLELSKEIAEHEKKMAALNGQDPNDPQAILREYDKRTQQRDTQVGIAESESAGAKVEAERNEEFAAQREVAARMQEQRVKDLESRGGYEQMERDVAARKSAAENELFLAQTRTENGLSGEELARLQKPIQEADVRLKQIREQLTKLPTPDGWQPIGDAKKDAEEKQAAMERERQRAASMRSEADDARRVAEDKRKVADGEDAKLGRTRERVRREQELDERQTEIEVAKQAGLPEPLPRLPGQPSVLLDPATRPLLNKSPPPAEEAATPAPEAEAPATESPAQDPAVQEMVSKLQGHISQYSGETRQMLEGLLATLTDGQGDTAGELAMINQMYAQATSDQQNAVGYLRQAVSGIAQLNNGYASAMGAMAQEIQSANSRVAQLQQQVDALSRNRPGF